MDWRKAVEIVSSWIVPDNCEEPELLEAAQVLVARVQSVNAHDDLLEALKECHEFIRSLLNATENEASDFLTNNGERVEDTAYNAIAKATVATVT